jgi:hypothetical protein
MQCVTGFPNENATRRWAASGRCEAKKLPPTGARAAFTHSRLVFLSRQFRRAAKRSSRLLQICERRGTPHKLDAASLR